MKDQSKWATVIGCLYVVIRGLDNWKQGVARYQAAQAASKGQAPPSQACEPLAGEAPGSAPIESA